MKVAVTYENGEVFQHFGRTPEVKIYTLENGDIKLGKPQKMMIPGWHLKDWGLNIFSFWSIVRYN